MRKLIRGIADFRSRSTPETRDRFAKLALGQRPDTLFVCCSDSRVAPNVFASTDPGDLFVVRNVGAIVPPCDHHGHSIHDRSEAAAIEFAVMNLEVQHIIVCGHSDCGAMHALHAGLENLSLPNLRSWVACATPALLRLKAGEEVNPGLSDVNRLSQINVLEQASHLLTYPIIRARVDARKLSIHAWWFDIGKGDVLAFDPREKRFEQVNEWAERVSLTGLV